LLAEYVELRPDARILVLGGGHGALAAAFAQELPQGVVLLHDTNWVALQCAEQTLAANRVVNAQISDVIDPPADEAGAYDVVLVLPPKNRALARRWLVRAHAALKPGGMLYLAGPNDEGIQSVIGDARDLFGQAGILGYRKGNRAAAALRSGDSPRRPDWAELPGILPGSWMHFQLLWEDRRLTAAGLPGVFSAEHLDPGTALLLPHLRVAPGARVLDLGCGTGVIGLVAALSGAGRVELIDIDLMAVAAATRTLAENGISSATVHPGDGVSGVQGRFDLIASNPPFHNGKQIDTGAAEAFLRAARNMLNRRGRLLIVANRFLPYERVLREHFGFVDRLADDGRYQVLEASEG
jgi:16S rRNA (guanine1207-N2)-methyltransferase